MFDHAEMQYFNGPHSVADGRFQIWGRHDVMKDCITCIYIQYKYSNYYLYSKITRQSFFFFFYQSINS